MSYPLDTFLMYLFHTDHLEGRCLAARILSLTIVPRFSALTLPLPSPSHPAGSDFGSTTWNTYLGLPAVTCSLSFPT